MPKRTDIKSILVLGSGPIVIGQACEFDYSGTQACRALRREGYRVVLVNSNPATIMTDPEFADATYIEPLDVETVAKVIAKERPDALLPTVGGQTALNLAVALDEAGVLEKYGVQLLGASIASVKLGEDRLLFKNAMERVGIECLRSGLARSLDEARAIAEPFGFPVVVRPSFTLGGTGGGIAFNRDDFEQIVKRGLVLSPVHEVLVEESVLGWKEFELELMRDASDTCVVVCSIENLDPMGVHTGDSITVAPQMTLTDVEYQAMRDDAKTVIRTVGVATGGSNIQFAVHPKTGRRIVIEMNPRVSRSSALASKATGFPIAKIAALLAVGYHLDEIPNDITKKTPASFEPSLDYVVVKIPRFTFEKFPGADTTLDVQMKSVGEVMALGRTFAESFGKALRSLETGRAGWIDADVAAAGCDARPAARADLLRPRGPPRRNAGRIRRGDHRHRPVVSRPVHGGDRDRGSRPAPGRRRALGRSAPPSRQTGRLFGSGPREALGPERRRGSRRPARTRRDARLQPGRHVRRGIRIDDAAPLLLLRDRGRVQPIGPGEGDRAGLRPEPDRAGSRVRLLLRARGRGDLRLRLRVGHDQLQSGDGLDGLRHVRPALLRAPHVRGRDRGRRTREAERRPRAVRRPDTAEARQAARGRGRSDPRHDPGRDRPRRGPRALRRAASGREPAGPAMGRRARRGGRPPGRAPPRISPPRPAELRARRPRDAHRVRRGSPREGPRGSDRRLFRPARAHRPFSRGRVRARRRRPRRRRARRRRGRHAAHRGGGHPLRRLVRRPAAVPARAARRARGDTPGDDGARPGARGAGPHERAVRDSRRRALRPRSEPARLADGPVRFE